ncbi:MAG: glycosyltransferase [Lachnospiraceae bacterium]|jgi:glycosyltransferase involved in cell wall biosynthesis|nr:glycosyltransferase [Lachnospiraceae bacterium]
MKRLAICIPNYGRVDKLKRLIEEISKQITDNDLTEQIQICISDDCSPENPCKVIKEIEMKYPQVEILFKRNEENRGMDYNFLASVLMASSLYGWIIGNDDMPTENGITKVMGILSDANADILMTPFDIFDDNEAMRGTIYPLKENREQVFDTSVKEQYSALLLSVNHNSGMFGFLSNIVFKREKWVEYQERFGDKMDTIFIQMYMNIETLKNGAVCLYKPEKIIKNYADDKTNESVDRICRILFGLDGVVEFFFYGKEKEHLKRMLVDAYISGRVWELPEENLYKAKLRGIDSKKNQLYKTYFIPKETRRDFYIGKKFIIYGAGNYGKEVYKDLTESGAVIAGIADSSPLKAGTEFQEFTIMSVDEMVDFYKNQDVYILVANHFALENMVHTLWENGIEKIGIIS